MNSSTNHRGPEAIREAQHGGSPVHLSELRPGDTVNLYCPPLFHRGVVDMVSADGAFLWMLLSDGTGRRLFTNAEVHKTHMDLSKLAGQTRVSR